MKLYFNHYQRIIISKYKEMNPQKKDIPLYASTLLIKYYALYLLKDFQRLLRIKKILNYINTKIDKL